MRSMKMRVMGATCAAAALSCVASAESVILTQNVPLQGTNWTQTISVGQFDDEGGALTLEAVTIRALGEVSASAGVENRSILPALVTLNLNTSLKVKLDGDQLIEMTPSMSTVFSAASFDGAIDFGGGSGATFPLGESMAEELRLEATAEDLSAWIGVGSVDLVAEAMALSFASGGSGDFITIFQTSMGVTIDVTYEFFRGETTPMLPLPSGAGLGLAGIGVLAARRRRRL